MPTVQPTRPHQTCAGQTWPTPTSSGVRLAATLPYQPVAVAGPTAIQKKKGTLVDRARAEALVFRLARQERDIWVTWPARVAALMAEQVAAKVEKQSGKPVKNEAAGLQRVLEVLVREQLKALADLRVSVG